MSSYGLVTVLSALAFCISLFLNHSPYVMVSTAPTKSWADGPMKLVTTPQYTTKKTDLFTTGATHMALLHNAVIRGFNSIYLQAPHVQDADKKNFVGYALTWHEFVKSHHDDEEANLFPKVEELLNDKTIWAETHKEHESFLGGLDQFSKYLSALPKPELLSSAELITIMDSFREPFEHHFHHEIDIIAGLGSHPACPKPGSDAEKEASLIFKTWGKKTVMKQSMTTAVPFFLLNLDATYEDGMWASWPPMPAPIRWGLVNLAGTWNGGYWAFASCDASGMPRELHALSGQASR